MWVHYYVSHQLLHYLFLQPFARFTLVCFIQYFHKITNLLDISRRETFVRYCLLIHNNLHISITYWYVYKCVVLRVYGLILYAFSIIMIADRLNDTTRRLAVLNQIFQIQNIKVDIIQIELELEILVNTTCYQSVIGNTGWDNQTTIINNILNA
jgi:hypothetical protein